jgi:hypothetical protein
MNKIMIKSVFLFLVLSVFSLQGCYLFCLFRPENKLEEILEQFVEEEIGALSEGSVDAVKKTAPASPGT